MAMQGIKRNPDLVTVEPDPCPFCRKPVSIRVERYGPCEERGSMLLRIMCENNACLIRPKSREFHDSDAKEIIYAWNGKRNTEHRPPLHYQATDIAEKVFAPVADFPYQSEKFYAAINAYSSFAMPHFMYEGHGSVSGPMRQSYYDRLKEQVYGRAWNL